MESLREGLQGGQVTLDSPIALEKEHWSTVMTQNPMRAAGPNSLPFLQTACCSAICEGFAYSGLQQGHAFNAPMSCSSTASTYVFPRGFK